MNLGHDGQLIHEFWLVIAWANDLEMTDALSCRACIFLIHSINIIKMRIFDLNHLPEFDHGLLL